jgi:RsiW-degrading membrane proteinase PrsW (M82 family)
MPPCFLAPRLLFSSAVNSPSLSIRRDEEIDTFAVRLYFFSRDRVLLFSLAVGLLALAAGVAWCLRAPDQWSNAPKSPEEALARELALPNPTLAAVLAPLPSIAGKASGSSADEVRRALAESLLAPHGKLVAVAYWESLASGTSEANAELLLRAHQAKPLAAANELVGDLHAKRRELELACTYYRRENEVSGAGSARAKLLDMLVRLKRHGELRVLAADPAFATAFTPRMRLAVAMHHQLWAEVVRALIAVEMETWKTLPLTLAGVAGLVWFVIAIQAIQPKQWVSVRTILPLLAVLAGLASAGPAHFVSIWQEEIWGFHPNGDFLHDYLFFLAGAAPREELIKLLFVLPFIPILLKRGSSLEMLIVCGCVGLGFAIERNLQSYQHGGPDGAFGRFLTANFFHLAATGLTGLALCRFLSHPRRGIVPLVLTVGGVIMAHGIYDAFMAVEGVRLLSVFSMMSFLALSLVFFHQLRQLRDNATDQLYISATLVIGMSLLSGAMLVCAAMQLGFPLAVTSLAANAAGLILVVCLFYRQLGQRLAPVLAEAEPVTT